MRIADDITFQYLHELRRINKFTVANFYIGKWECDMLAVSNKGFTHEIEVKISRSDFKNDFKKLSNDYKYNGFQKGYSITHADKHTIIQEGKRVNRFSYLVPENLISIDEVPEYAGLIYAKKYGLHYFFSIVKKPKLLNKEAKFDNYLKDELLNKYHYSYMYYMNKLYHQRLKTGDKPRITI